MYLKFYVIFQIYPAHFNAVYHLAETILAILYREVPQMLLAKYQPNLPIDSGEEVVWMVFTIYGHGGHIEFRIMTFLAKFCKTIIQMLNIKFH